jgi:hypothetical protein
MAKGTGQVFYCQLPVLSTDQKEDPARHTSYVAQPPQGKESEKSEEYGGYPVNYFFECWS